MAATRLRIVLDWICPHNCDVVRLASAAILEGATWNLRWLTLGILIAGIVAVVGGVLALRLHAFLALILGALLVGALTPTASIERYETERRSVSLVDLDEFEVSDLPNAFRDVKRNCVFLDVDASRGARLGSKYLLLRWEADIREYREAAELEIVDLSNASRRDGQRIPLGKAMCVRTGCNYLLFVLTIVAGATMAHSLVPPTPGPLFVAEQLGVDLGVMILGGAIVGLFTAGVGCAWAYRANAIGKLPLRESSDLSLETLEEISQREESDLPPTWLALMPILLPVLLIGGYAVLKRLVSDSSSEWMSVAATLGDKNIALIVSAAVALATLVRQKRTRPEGLAQSAQAALASGGIIILITAVGILSGLAADLPFHPVYLALAIGCGSKPVSWMNDSGFWVITKMSGMTEAEGLKYVTPMTALMGVVGLIVTLVGVTLFP